MTLALYGHPFSSYTWKAQIALHANDTAYVLKVIDPDHPENGRFIAEHGGPWGTFPVLVDGENVIFEASSIIEYLALHHPGAQVLLPPGVDAAIAARMLDRVFDNYVMSPMQAVVSEHIADPANPDQARCAAARERLGRTYRWLEDWLAYYPVEGQVSLVECAAAAALFYADWVHPIGDVYPRLQAWRAHLLALPAVAKCVEAARPFRAYFPLGAPDRD
jgi:glutathione S-transferase